MGTFKQFVESNTLTPQAIYVASSKLEASSNKDRRLLSARTKKRRTAADKTYAELNIAKPNAGRAVSVKQIQAALADAPVTRKSRSKILRAVNTLLERKKKAKVEMKTLFEGTVAKKGAKPVDKKAEKK